jgi:hypothetical protein
VRCPLADVRLLRTAILACSRSGSARTRLGGFVLRDFDFGIGDGSFTVADSFISGPAASPRIHRVGATLTAILPAV